MMSETYARSFIKTLTYRGLGSIVTALIVLVFTRRADFSLSAGVMDFAAKLGVYFLHERMWASINFGTRREDGSLSCDG